MTLGDIKKMIKDLEAGGACDTDTIDLKVQDSLYDEEYSLEFEEVKIDQMIRSVEYTMCFTLEENYEIV